MSQAHDERNRKSLPSTPTWVKVFGVVALILVLLVGIMLLSGGEHGPGRHIPINVTEEHTSSTEQGVGQP